MTATQSETRVSLDLEQLAERTRSGDVLLVGIGNTMFGDDGAGCHLVQRLEGKTRAALLDTGQSPEAYLGEIANATNATVVLVDTVDFKSSPGTVAIFGARQLPDVASGTHRIPLALIMDYLSRTSTGEVCLLGIQPERTQLGAEMSPAVRRSIEYLAELLSTTDRDATDSRSPASGVMK